MEFRWHVSFEFVISYKFYLLQENMALVERMEELKGKLEAAKLNCHSW